MSRTYRGWNRRMANGCRVTGKTSFRSAVAARAFVEACDEWHGEAARAYRCEWCDWYHLTSQPTRWEMLRAAAAAA